MMKNSVGVTCGLVNVNVNHKCNSENKDKKFEFKYKSVFVKFNVELNVKQYFILIVNFPHLLHFL